MKIKPAFHSAWPVAIACLLACTFAIIKPAQADLTTPPYKIYTYSIDETNSKFQYVYTINHFAGGGAEPMLDIRASLHFYGGFDTTRQAVGSGFDIAHQILPLSGLPSGFTGQIPYMFDIRIEGNVTGGILFGVTATANGVGYNNGYGASLSYSKTFSGLADPGSTIMTSLSANMALYGGFNETHSDGQIIVDPYIYVDPTWQYASYFGVFQQPGPNDNGVWQQVNRDWMALVPIPAAVWLLGSGLIGLVAIRRRFRK